MPGFSLELDDATPSAGQSITVTVAVHDYGEPDQPATWFSAPDLDGLLALYRATELSARGRPRAGAEARPIGLRLVEPGRYRGRIRLPAGGQWAIVPFPTSRNYDIVNAATYGYPDTLALTASGKVERSLLIPAVVAGLGLSLVLLGYRWQRRRRFATAVTR